MALDKEKSLALAQKYAEKEQYDKAIREIRAVLEQDAQDSRVLLRLASYCEMAGYYTEAGHIYQRISSIFQSQGSPQKALAVLKQAQKYQPEDDDVSFKMTELYAKLGLSHEANNQLERAMMRAEQRQDERQLEKCLQMMVQVDGENIQARCKYADFLLLKGKMDAAVRQYSLALAQLLSKERYVDYIQTARNYLKIVNKDIEVLKNIANIYLKMRRYEEAVALFTQFEPHEKNSEILEILMVAYTELRRPKEAIQQAKLLIQRYRRGGRSERSIEELWRKIQALDPDDWEAAEALGEDPPLLSNSAISFVATNRQGAIHDAYEEEPEEDLQSQFERALQEYRQGNMDEAVQLCKAIVLLDEGFLPALRLLSDIYERQQDKFSLAHVERKLARAVYQSDLEEAIRHVLKAERYAPKSWENFNLMLLFGVEPAKYGMRPPESTGSGLSSALSSQRINPSSVPSLPTIRSSSQVNLNAQGSEREGLAEAKLPPPIPRLPLKTIDIPAPLQVLSHEVLGELKSLESRQSEQSSRPQPSVLDKEDHALKDLLEEAFFDPSASSIEEALDEVFTELFNDELFQKYGGTATKASLTAQEQAQIDESVKEIAFFASIAQQEEAQNLFNQLIERFGERREFQELRLRYGLFN